MILSIKVVTDDGEISTYEGEVSTYVIRMDKPGIVSIGELSDSIPDLHVPAPDPPWCDSKEFGIRCARTAGHIGDHYGNGGRADRRW